MIDHDQLFKELLSTFFFEFLELFYPQVAEKVERESISFLPQEFFTDLTSGQRQVVDLLAEVKLSGQEAGILIHIEAQSSSVANFDRRMFFYFARLYQKYLRKVYPIVLFSFDRPLREEPHSHVVEIEGFRILDFNFAAVQLNRLSWRDYLMSQNPVAAALMAKMKIAPEDRPKVKVECLRLLASLNLNPAKTQLISGFVDSYLKLSEAENRQFQRAISTMDSPEQEGIMQIVTSWMEEGIAQGREQGARDLLMFQLSTRFGELDSELQQSIEDFSLEQIQNLSGALFDLSSLDDLVQWGELL